MSQNDEFEELREDFAGKARERERRRLEKLWAKMIPTDNEITLRWLEPAVDGEPRDVEAIIGNERMEWRCPPEYRDGMELRKRRARDYDKAAEVWATWRWHMMRGTPVTERDVYQTEPGYRPPTFVWEEGLEQAAEPVKRKPGRPPKEASAA